MGRVGQRGRTRAVQQQQQQQRRLLPRAAARVDLGKAMSARVNISLAAAAAVLYQCGVGTDRHGAETFRGVAFNHLGGGSAVSAFSILDNTALWAARRQYHYRSGVN